MFKIEDGKIVITSAAAHISQEYTPEEWEAHILFLLDERSEAQRELAELKPVEIPERPANMDITAFVQWKIEADEAAKQRAALENRKQELRLKSDSAERKIVAMMPENVMLSIEDDENDCTYSIWWTSKHDNCGNWYPDVRINSSPNTASVVPMSQQIDGDDLESDLEKALWDIETDEDGLEVEYEDEDTVEEYGDDNEPPAPATVDDIPF